MMNDDMARVAVRVDAVTDRFDSGMSRTRRTFAREARSIETRAARLDSRLATTGSRFGQGFSRQGRNAFGNVAFQIQDIAVQAEAGTSALRIFTQQGPQIAGAFGPAGAVIGAFVAVGASLASTLIGAGSAADDTAGSIDRLALSTGALESGMSGLEGVAHAYADAIRTTGDAQDEASRLIVARTREEFEAKRQLLAQQVKIQEATQATRDAAIAGLNAKLAGPTLQDPGNRKGRNLRSVEQRNSRLQTEFEAARPGLEDERTRLSAERTFAQIAIDRAEEALGLTFEDTLRKVQAGAARSGGGAGGRSRKEADIVALGRDRIRALAEERQAVGLVGAELERLQARQQATRLERDLLKKAASDGTAVTEQERAQIVGLKTEYLLLAEGVIRAKQQEENRLRTLERVKKRTEEARKSQAELGRALLSGVGSARNFGDALKQLAVNAALLGAQGLFGGTGPLGGVFTNLFGPAGNANGSLKLNALGGVYGANGQITAFAKGGVVNAPTMFGFKGGTGLMGEAGPEAILPLKRGPGGRLGVEAGSGGAGGPVINVDARNASDPAAIRIAAELGARQALQNVPGVVSGMRRHGRI